MQQVRPKSLRLVSDPQLEAETETELPARRPQRLHPNIKHIRQSLPRLSHAVIVRAPGLLPMWYTPLELETKLGLPARCIREWLESQAIPHQKDSAGHIWIDGRAFAAWVARVRAGRKQIRQPLSDGQAFCLSCRQAVPLVAPTARLQGKRLLLCGHCPQCGASIQRGVRHG